MKTIVVSAVNLNVGGTLTILRECLSYLSDLAKSGDYRIVALVHKKELASFDNIEYIELPWSKKKWINRIWCEYVTMKRISKELAPVYLWFSLHDTTPNVTAERQAVYCHNPFPFYQWRWRELFFNYKIVLFAWFSYFIYRINIHRNKFVVVQQQWIREEFKRLFSLMQNQIIVAPPEAQVVVPKKRESLPHKEFYFFYPSSPNIHKNFETFCEASRLLENEVGEGVFRSYITIAGSENKYAEWLNHNWGKVKSLDFTGFMGREELYYYYDAANCLVFPSKVETWGLPITEFMQTEKPMLLADLPYAYETAAGSKRTAFFPATNAVALKDEMKRVLFGDYSKLKEQSQKELEFPSAYSWKALFEILLKG